MSQSVTRHPPRFVPTLTDVVPDDQALNSTPNLSRDPELFADEASAQSALPPATQDTEMSPPGKQAEHAHEAWVLAAQSIQARVMERVEESLEERLRYALAEMVQLHTQSLYQALRTDIEQVVHAAVHEALAQELAQTRKPTDG